MNETLKPLDPKRLVDSEGAAAYLGMSERWLQERRRDGTLPAIYLSSRTVRYRVADLDNYVDRLKKTTEK